MYFPPPHPMFVNFTAALIPVSLASDLLGRILRKQSLQAVGLWGILYGTLATPITCYLGLRWMNQLGRHGKNMVIHEWLGFSMVAILILLSLWRIRLYRHKRPASAPYLLILVVLFGSAAFQGHTGAVMTFHPNEENTAIASTPQPAPSLNASDPHDLGDGWRTQIEVKPRSSEFPTTRLAQRTMR